MPSSHIVPDDRRQAEYHNSLLAGLQEHVPVGYVIPQYASMWWLRGVTLYLNDQRLPSARAIHQNKFGDRVYGAAGGQK